MRILGIETSCDETAISILEADSKCTRPKILAEEISSQVKLHALYGGVVPELASREHLSSLPLVTELALRAAGCKLADLNLIAVTRGPGLLGCLLMGMHFAQGLALAHSIPLVDVNHIEAHILSPWLDNPEMQFPYLGLVVSGGHTELHVVKGVGDYELISRTIDDAAGEAFDKSAALLGLAYPGGPKLAKLADEFRSSGQTTSFSLPRVMADDARFSFSGLKTAILMLVRKNKNQDGVLSPEVQGALAYVIQEAIVSALADKVLLASHKTGIKRIGISGGVSANVRLFERLSLLPEFQIMRPDRLHCMDNATMIAALGWERFNRGLQLQPGAGVLSRWPIEEVYSGTR